MSFTVVYSVTLLENTRANIIYTTHPKVRYHVNTTYKGTSAALLSDEYLSKYKVNIRNCIPTETRFPREGTVNIPFKKTAGYH